MSNHPDSSLNWVGDRHRRPPRIKTTPRLRRQQAATAGRGRRRVRRPGIAGARVDPIESAAQANKRLIYDYFGDKDGLFDAVMDANMDKVIGANPMDANDLPGYAGRWFDYSREPPTRCDSSTGRGSTAPGSHCPRQTHTVLSAPARRDRGRPAEGTVSPASRPNRS